MTLHRRALLGALGAAGAVAGAAAHAQTPEAAPQDQTLEQRLTALALQHRSRLDFDGARFSGPAYETLLAEGRASQFFCIGEEHGIAENPKLAAQLFAELVGAGYAKACIEISPPLAAELDRAARAGMEGVRALFADPRANVAFFGMREEAEWIVAARDAAPGRSALWGLDYEVGGLGRVIDRLTAMRMPAPARAPFAALRDAHEAMWAQFQQTRSPQHIFSFAGDPDLVRAVRASWPNPAPEADWMLATLEETLTINQFWLSRQGWASNEARARFNRANFRRYWSGERNPPRVMFKFGMSHMVRGLSHTYVFDIGTQVSEQAEALGSKSFHLAVLPGAGAQHARMNVQTWRYEPATAGAYAEMGLGPLYAAAHEDAMTLIDLRPFRAVASGQRAAAFNADFVRMAHGFDALLIMTGSTASANL